MANDVTKITGFSELNQKLKQLDDKVTRREVLKIQRQLAKPVISAYSSALPVRSGTLSRSVKAETVPARKANGNPSIAIRPGKKGKNDGWYKWMVIHKGARPGSRRRGGRKGINTVVEEARDKVLKSMASGVLKQNEEKIAAYVQKQINRLNK